MGKKISIVLALLGVLGVVWGFTVKWKFGLGTYYDRMSFGASAALADLGPDVNSVSGEPDQYWEVIVGSDEYGIYYNGSHMIGAWRCIDALGNLEWIKDTQTDEARSSVAVGDFVNPGDGNLEIFGGTTSGWNVEAMDRFGNFLWTFPSPPMTDGDYLWHSSPAIADIVPALSGYELVIGNNPCSALYCFQVDPSDGIDNGIHFDVHSHSDCFDVYFGFPAGSDGTDWDVLWVFNTDGPVISTPALDDIDADGHEDVVFGTGYIPTYNPDLYIPGGTIYCLDGPSGTLRWSIHTGGIEIVEASPALADFDGDGDLEVVVGAFDHKLYLIDGDEDDDGTISSTEMTTIPMPGNIKSSCAIGDVNGDGEPEIIACDMAGNVFCISYSPPTEYSIVWEQTLDTAIVGSPALAWRNDPAPWTHFCANPRRDNFYPVLGETLAVFVPTLGGWLYRLNGATGVVEDSIKVGNYIHTSPVLADIDLDCELELVITACNDPDGTIPDTIVCLGTGLTADSCDICRGMTAQPLCPPADTTVIVSCPQQRVHFLLADTTFRDFPDTVMTFATARIHHGEDSYIINLMGGSNRMNFTRTGNDSFSVEIWNDWHHGDTVQITLDSALTFHDCTTHIDQTISFIVDLQPPQVNITPAPGIISVADSVFHLNFYDEPAGIMWSSVECFTHLTGPWSDTTISGDINGDSLIVPGINPGDTVLLSIRVCDSIDDYGCTCEPNCTTYTFRYSILSPGPTAFPILPTGISACVDQEILIMLSSLNPVDSSTVRLVINSDTFACADSCFTLENDTLRFSPPENFWSDGETVTVALIQADDIYGNHLQAPLEWQFMLDFSPPTAEMTSPIPDDTIRDPLAPININIQDNLAGILVDSSYLTVNGEVYEVNQVLAAISPDSLTGELAFSPAEFGIRWFPGETITVALHLCDFPDTCGPNCADYLWRFYLAPDYGCARIPNPFTPNLDLKNDYCQFYFPGLGTKRGKIYIFDTHERLVKLLNVPAGENAKLSARWDGTDTRGTPLTEGVYLYVIEVEGEIVCEGTITIAR